MRTHFVALGGFAVAVACSAALGIASEGERYEPSPERRTVAPTTTSTDQRGTVIRCAAAPRIPEDTWVEVRRTDTTVTVAWGARHGWPEFTVRLDDPTCRDRPDLGQWLVRPVGTFPRFEDARIVVRPGIECAYVGYTLFGDGEPFRATLEDITAVGPDGRPIDWKHQTATGGPAEITNSSGRQVVTPDGAECGVPGGGDADYFDARDVEVGETILVTFRFFDDDDTDDGDDGSALEPTRTVEVPFKVVDGTIPLDQER